MLFHEPLIRPILRGEKTTHRRPLRLPRPTRNGWSSPWRPPKVGESLAVQGTDRRIRVTAVGRARLAALTKAEAKAEGYYSPAAFVMAWMLEHDLLLRRARRADPDWLPPQDMLLEAFEQRCAGEPIWLIRFQLDDETRLLAPCREGARPRFQTLPSGRQVAGEDVGGDELGYTSAFDALDAGEAVDVDRLSPDWWRKGALVHAAARSAVLDERLAPLTPAERYRELLETARATGVDVRSDDRVIQRRLDAIEAKLRRQDAA